MPELELIIFANDLQEALHPENEFYFNSMVDGGVDIKAAKVQIPQQGAAAVVITNPTSFPLPIQVRTDDIKEYDVDHLATLPVLVPNANQAVLNYNKGASVVKNQSESLIDQIAEISAFAWSATTDANIVRTSGANGSDNGPIDSTGDRKVLSKLDFINLNKIKKRSKTKGPWMVLLEPGLEAELLNIEEFVSLEKIGDAVLVEGAIGRLLGFQIFVRAEAQTYNNDSTPAPKPVGSVVGATDNLAAIAWNPRSVRRGQSPINAMTDVNSPTLLGTVTNAELRFGASISRLDFAGVAAIVQSAV